MDSLQPGVEIWALGQGEVAELRGRAALLRSGDRVAEAALLLGQQGALGLVGVAQHVHQPGLQPPPPASSTVRTTHEASIAVVITTSSSAREHPPPPTR